MKIEKEEETKREEKNVNNMKSTYIRASKRAEGNFAVADMLQWHFYRRDHKIGMNISISSWKQVL